MSAPSPSESSTSLNPEGYVVLARITPPCHRWRRSPRRTCPHDPRPQRRQHRRLPPSGGTITFTDARFAIAEGERYGLELRIIRIADGIHSRPFFADLIRKENTDADLPAASAERGTGVPEKSAATRVARTAEENISHRHASDSCVRPPRCACDSADRLKTAVG